MRSIASLLITSVCLLPAAGAAQAPSNNISLNAKRANEHYKSGWDAVRKEAWDDAAREFHAAIDSDSHFALAYYALGRAQMGRRDFAAAIAAYTRCRELMLSSGGEEFTSQLDRRQRINDRIQEYRNVLTQATVPSSGTKSGGQSQSLYVRELQAQISRLEEARDQTINMDVQVSVPYYVPLALGAAYFRNGQTADAEREYKAAIAANNASGETHNNLAVLYLTTGRYDEAEAEVKAAEKVGFKVPEALKGDIHAGKRKAGSPR